MITNDTSTGKAKELGEAAAAHGYIKSEQDSGRRHARVTAAIGKNRFKQDGLQKKKSLVIRLGRQRMQTDMEKQARLQQDSLQKSQQKHLNIC